MNRRLLLVTAVIAVISMSCGQGKKESGASSFDGLNTSVMSSAHSADPFNAGVNEKSPCVRVRSTVAANSGVNTTWSVPFTGTMPEV